EELQKLRRMLPRLLRNTGQAKARQRAQASPALLQMRADILLDPPAAPLSVEYALRAHWHSETHPVFYVENALINSLFGLLCWPAIFAPVQGAFFHPFQSGPADLSAPDFCARRSHEFALCLAQLDTPDYAQTILQRYAEKQGVQSPFVFWGVLTEPLLRLALDCISAAHLKLLFARLMQDVKTNRSGFPDLVRFWPAENRYELVEVKGPGDKLQDNQIRWLQYCSEHGIPVSVCHVQWRGAEDGP
ncbi:VRR-NUC domain-containing protein, partial [Acidovorax cavernicola]